MSTDPVVADGRRLARRLTARGGRTYFLAAQLLPQARREAIFALYGFARTVDDVVDGDLSPAVAAARLDVIEDALHRALTPDSSCPDDAAAQLPELPGLLAVLAEAVDRFAIPTGTFDDFLRSMRMDVPGTSEFTCRYRTFDELARYTHGSAAVIGHQLIGVLGADPSDTEIIRTAGLLGEAFQLTNFLRDVAEDLDRDRIYLPLAELAAFGVDEPALRADRTAGHTRAPLRRALAHLIAVNRDLYRQAWPGIGALPTFSRPAITAAATTYHDILSVIEESGYAVMDRRAVVSRRRRVMRAVEATFRTPGPAPGG